VTGEVPEFVTMTNELQLCGTIRTDYSVLIVPWHWQAVMYICVTRSCKSCTVQTLLMMDKILLKTCRAIKGQ